MNLVKLDLGGYSPLVSLGFELSAVAATGHEGNLVKTFSRNFMLHHI